MVGSEVVEALLYGCVTWTPLKCHYAKLRTTHHRMLLRELFNDWGGRGYDDSVPGEVPKTASSGDRAT